MLTNKLGISAINWIKWIELFSFREYPLNFRLVFHTKLTLAKFEQSPTIV